MNRITKLILIGGIAFLFGVIAIRQMYPSPSPDGSTIESTNGDIQPTVQTYIKKDFFIPVVGFTVDKFALNSGDFQNTNFLYYSEDLDLDQLPIANYIEISQGETETKLNEGNIILYPLEDLEPNLKVLTIDNIHPLESIKNNSEYVFSSKQEVTEKPMNNPEIVSIFATGEIIPARAVDRLGLNKHNEYTYLYDFFKEELENSDISIGLLENPLNGNPTPCTGCLIFVGDEQNAKALKKVGFDVLSLAGNHAGDGGQSGYSSTVQLLNEANLPFTGTGKTSEEKMTPAIVKVNDLNYGFLAADDVASYDWENGIDSYSTNSFSKSENGSIVIDKEKITSIPEIKEQSGIDFLTVYMSWGIEYTNKANERQQEIAHLLIENGVDLIVGSHPHWIQNLEIYKDVPIIYSMGNFVFDQTHTDPTREAMVSTIYLINDVPTSIYLTPLKTCGYHQTANDRTADLLDGDLSLEEISNFDESHNCIYWQPQALEFDDPTAKTIFERVYEFTEF